MISFFISDSIPLIESDFTSIGNVIVAWLPTGISTSKV